MKIKSIKVKKSPEVLGLSKKSKKESFKIKKTPKASLSTSKRDVISKHLPESDADIQVKIFGKKNSNKEKKILKEDGGQRINESSPVKTPKKKKNKKVSLKKDDLPKVTHKESSSSTVENKVEKSPVADQKVNYIDSKQVFPAVQALLTYCKTKNKNLLFKSEGTPIFAQFASIAVIQHPKTTLRLSLAHSIHSRVSDVLLIITDEKKHHRKLRHDDDMYIINYTEKLKQLGVTQVSKVMTLRQIRAEYYTHEMRRKFCDMFDVFLCDGKVSKKLSSLLGRNFFLKRKVPVPVGLEKESKIKSNIEKSLKKTNIVLKSTSCSNSVVRIGSTDMKPEELAENLEAFSKAMDTCQYPGGWRNVKVVHIKTPTSTTFPVYYSRLTPNDIGKAELKHSLPKNCVAVKGELSTIGRDVIVRPDGTIEVEGVDDMESLMNQLYKHSGFKDSETLDLTNDEYKEVLKELKRHSEKKPKAEENKAADDADVGDMLVDSGSDESSDEDDNSIHGEIQGDEENDDEDFRDSNDEEEEKGDGVEANYMQEWEQTWLNQNSDEEQEGKQKDKKKKSTKNQGKQQQQGNKKRKQKTEPDQGGKKQKIHKLKKADKESDAKDETVKRGKRSGKKDTPLRKKDGVKFASVEDVGDKKKKKSRSSALNYIPL